MRLNHKPLGSDRNQNSNETNPYTNSSFGSQLNSTIVSHLDIRAFIMGVDISNWVKSFSVTYDAEIGSLGSATLVIDNPNNIFIITDEDLIHKTTASWSGKDHYSNRSLSVNHGPKLQLLHFKQNHNTKVLLDGAGASGIGGQRWTFTENCCIFHRMDTVKVYIKYPWTNHPSQIYKSGGHPENERSWIPAFTGFIDSVSYNVIPYFKGVGVNHSADTDQITLQCCDIRKILQQSRVVLNPQLIAAAAGSNNEHVISAENESFVFKDLVPPEPEVFTSFLTRKDIPTIINAMIYGNFLLKDAKSQRAKEDKRYRIGQVEGCLNIETTYSEKTNLDTWYLQCAFGKDKHPLTLKEVLERGAKSYDGGEYSPIGKNFKSYALLPSGSLEGIGDGELCGWDWKELGELALQDSSGTEISWSTRLEILNELFEKLDFRMWINGNGDMIIEPPMWGDTLEEYKLKEIKELLTLGKLDGQQKFQVSEEDTEIYTIVRVEGKFQGHNFGVNGPNSSGGGAFTVCVFMPGLMFRYGQNVTSITCPLSGAKDESGTSNILSCKKLALWGLIYLMNALKKMLSFSFEPIQFRPLLPNKIFRVEGVGAEGILNSVTHDLDFEHASFTTSFDMHGIKRNTYMDNGNNEFVYDITGTKSLPFTWKMKWSEITKNLNHLKFDINCGANKSGDDVNVKARAMVTPSSGKQYEIKKDQDEAEFYLKVYSMAAEESFAQINANNIDKEMSSMAKKIF